MNISSKKLITISLIFLVLPFITLLTFQSKDVAAESPTVSITNVTSTSDYKISVSVEISLSGFNYDYYTQYLRLYLNQSIDTILDNNYNGYNSSKEFGRQSTTTFSTSILSPILTDGSHSDSAYYNITVLAITNTDEKSNLEQWSGGYYYIDTELPIITFINPSTPLEEVWGIYQVEVNIIDDSNLSLIRFFVDNVLRYEDDDPTPGETNFKWDWICSPEDRGNNDIKITAIDDTPAKNKEESSLTITVVGPTLKYNESLPSYIDSNDTLALNVTVTDSSYNIDTVQLHYALNDVWANVTMTNETADQFIYVFPEQPIGTKINWEIFANNTAGQYHVFRDTGLEYWEIYSVYPDHIKPVGEVIFENQYEVNSPVIVQVNITEQSPINQCRIYYQMNEDDWEDTLMSQTDNDTTWFIFSYDFGNSLPIFTQIHFYIRLNDSGNNILLLNNNGKNYKLKIIPSDLIAPNVTIITSPDIIKVSQNITITVEINETSALASVKLYYTINSKQYSLDMIQISANTWTASFIIIATTGDEVQIWAQATDEFYNTGISEVKTYEVESNKTGLAHNNFFLVLMLVLLIVLPIVITLLILRPQR